MSWVVTVKGYAVGSGQLPEAKAASTHPVGAVSWPPGLL